MAANSFKTPERDNVNDSAVLYSPSQLVHIFADSEDDCPSLLSDWSGQFGHT